jgi:hypothetical protein
VGLNGLVKHGAQVGLWLALIVITYLALTPQPDAPGLGWDKANHVAAFLVLALLADLGWPARAGRLWRLGMLLGYGLSLELAQSLLAHREGSALDLLADAVGLGLYVGGRALWMRAWQVAAIQLAMGERSRGEADLVDHAEVAKEMDSWGTEDEPPAPT